MKEINYILKRVLQMIPVLLLVMVLIFALIRFIPGDPADVMLGARATEESRAMLHAKMGIDKPIYEQFFLFMKNCLRLDFGESILSGEPVSQILARRFQVTASLTGMTALFTMLLALPIGYFSGVNKHNAAGKAVNTSALVVMAVPAFWVGILLMYFFGLKLHWFPISGWGDTLGEHVWSLILPAFTQSLGISALLIRNMQNEVAQILKYATRNSLIILDEVGRGTSTFDGMSIARAVMEYIHEKIKAKTLFATHYHQLIELENIMEGVKNYSVAVKERGNDIVFLRRIVRGGSDKSYGVHVARLAGLPKKVLERANEFLKEYDSEGPKQAQPAQQQDGGMMGSLFGSALQQRLANMDVMSMTPIEAMNTLYKLQEEAKREGGAL